MLDNKEFLEREHEKDIILLDVICPHKPDGTRRCTFEANPGNPPNPELRDVVIPVVWSRDEGEEKVKKTFMVKIW